MSEDLLAAITQSLNLAVFQRLKQGRLHLAAPAPEWLPLLWPAVIEQKGLLAPGTSPVLENFLASRCWRAGQPQRVRSEPWLEPGPQGRTFRMQATALSTSAGSLLLIEASSASESEPTPTALARRTLERTAAQLPAAPEQLHALSLRLVEVQEAERRFLAHELHDEIGQLLTGLKLTLELSVRNSAELDPPLREAIGIVDDLMNRVRQLSLDLRPHILDDLGLVPALEWLLKRYGKQTGIQVNFKPSGLRGRFSSQLETAAFRIVQEALTNIARHAGVKEATVRLCSDGDYLRVQVEDRGTGFEPSQVLVGCTSSGVAGMRQRAVVLGGKFTLDSAPGAGTRLKVELPLDSVPRLAQEDL